MKAAVLHKFGETPRYEDFSEPVAAEGEILVHVQAVALENIDRAMAAGTHYATSQMLPTLPAVLGFDGIGKLDDGRLIGFGGIRPPYGALAPLTVIKDKYYVLVPEGIDAPTVAAAPGSIMSSMLPLQHVAKLQRGETVLIHGATGFAGKLGVQVAKLLGAGRVVGSGRSKESLAELPGLGADATVDLTLPDDALVEAFEAAKGDGYDVIIDFLWGHPTELLLQALTPKALAFPPKRTRLVQIGEAAGRSITLGADALRTSGLEISGAGNIPHDVIPEATELTYSWLREGKLRCDIECVPLKDIETAWARTDLHGKRLVIVP